MIKTIDDLRNASKKEIEKAKESITVVEDLESYIRWLNSPKGGRATVHFTIGWDQRRAESLGLHPSALAKTTPCLLKLFNDVTGNVKAKPKIDPTTYMTFDVGTAVHSLLQAHFLQMYEDQFEEEVWLRDKRILINSSHTDGRFNFSAARFLLEIKTIKEGGNYGWEKIQDRPFPDNIRQVMTYMYLDNCPFGLILYWCKNNSKFKEHIVTWDDEIWNAIKGGTIAPVMVAVEKDEAPIPTPGFHCQWCDYLHACEAGRRGKVATGKNKTRGRTVRAGTRIGHVRRRRT